jgi:hypothetical protein
MAGKNARDHIGSIPIFVMIPVLAARCSVLAQ